MNIIILFCNCESSHKSNTFRIVVEFTQNLVIVVIHLLLNNIYEVAYFVWLGNFHNTNYKNVETIKTLFLHNMNNVHEQKNKKEGLADNDHWPYLSTPHEVR